MKTIKYLFALCVLLCTAGCTESAVSDLEGRFSEVGQCAFTKAAVAPTDKLRKGVKALNITLSGADNQAMTLRLGSKEWVLSGGSFTPVAEVSSANTYSGTVNGAAIAGGDLDVNQVDSVYFLNGLVKTADGKSYHVSYQGTLPFVVGQDDPEASGCMMSVQTQPVTVMDMTTYQQTVIPGITKYVVTFSDPEGKSVGLFELVAKEKLKPSELVGTYKIQGSPAAAGLCGNGYVVPQYNVAGGSYIADAKGNKQYLAAGDVTLAVAKDVEGRTLYSISSKNTKVLDATGAEIQTPVPFNISYAELLEAKGTLLRDLKIKSTYCNREMKYSIYLPEGYTADKKYPVLYMLHGYGDDNNAWLDKGNLAALTTKAVDDGTVGKMIVVMPDALQSFYSNGVQEAMKYEDYFFQELMPAVEKAYSVKTDRNSRAVGGLSMGGFGTLLYAFKHHELFCCAYAMSPATGNGKTNLTNEMKNLKTNDYPDITIEVGTEDATVYAMAAPFGKGMQAMGLSNYTYIERAGMHDWNFWKECYPKFMKRLGNYFK